MESKKRFIEYILKEPERFLPYAFEENPRIKNLPDLEGAFRSAFPKQDGSITTDEIIALFETPECKRRIRENTTDKEFEDVYGDGHAVIYTTERTKIIKTEIPKIKSHGYSRETKTIRGYSRTKPRKFSPVETRFIQVRKQKKMTPKQIIADYDKHFSQNPRTSSSIRTKIYRI